MPAVTDIPGIAGAYEKLNPTSATGITATLVKPTSGSYNNNQAAAALITVEGGAIRFTLDGTTPTTSVGHNMAVGDSFMIRGVTNVSNFKCIDNGGTSSVYVTVFYPHDSIRVNAGI
jgi:hypothetical protein